MKTLKEILPLVEKPSRYTGGEWGEPELVPSKFNYCICFPDVYEVGMSNLGIKIVAESIRSVPDTCVDRCFAPWPDFGTQLKENQIPLFSLGLKWGLNKFDMIGFSLQYEMSYTAVLYMLDLANIPLKSCDRGEEYRIIQAFFPRPKRRWSLSFFFLRSKLSSLRQHCIRNFIHSVSISTTPICRGEPFISTLKLHLKLSSRGVIL